MTSNLKYEFEQRPDAGETVEVAPGIFWLTMPLPFLLGHINLWLLADGDGWAIVDTGIHTETSREVWKNVFARGFTPITRVIVTHLHPDHVGCAGWLAEQNGVDLYMSRAEYLLCRVLKTDTGRETPPAAIRFYRSAGYGDEQLASFKKRFGRFGMIVSPLPDSYIRLKDGDTLNIGEEKWEILVGRGHSPEHACLFNASRNLLLSGDQILPTISSNISVWPTEPDADPLADWLDSLEHLRQRLPEDVLVMPAHGKPFRGAHQRLQELTNEHLDALEKLKTLCATPKRTIDVFPALFKSKITDGNLLMAAGEAIAHLNYLSQRGMLTVNQDADGVNWYQSKT